MECRPEALDRNKNRCLFASDIYRGGLKEIMREDNHRTSSYSVVFAILTGSLLVSAVKERHRVSLGIRLT